nr:hypothetical protein [Tanacetum cinerariifolium]
MLKISLEEAQSSEDIFFSVAWRTTRYEKIQKNDLWLLSMFEARHQNGYANVAWRALRVQIALMQDLYECMGSMDIKHEAIERIEYRHAYHWDRYQGVFEHKAGVYNVPLQGDYNAPGYAQPQYDQYYQQYYP